LSLVLEGREATVVHFNLKMTETANWYEVWKMGKCLKGESTVKKKDAKFYCETCGAKTDKKGNVCKPGKVTKGKKK
jgi:Zn finger protein HypA/HybF involved in hydrogenase expression